MRANKFISLDGREAVMIGPDNRLPALDASDLINLDIALKGSVVEILDTMPESFDSSDSFRMFYYVGSEAGYVSNMFYLVVEYDDSFVLQPLSFSSGDGGSSLPPVGSQSAGNVLTVSENGEWVSLPPKTALPKIDVSEEGYILRIVDGKWKKVVAPVSATEETVNDILGISGSGSEDKVLSQKGTFVELPEIDIDVDIGIDRADGDTQKYLSEKGTFESLPGGVDVDNDIGIDRVSGDDSKVLSQKGTFVELPSEIDVIDEIGIDKTSGSDNKYLSEKGNFIELSGTDVASELNIDKVDGDTQKYLSEKGTFESLPEEVDVSEELGINKASGDEGKYLSEKGTFKSLPDIDINSELGIDGKDGVETKVLSQKGSFVDLPEDIDVDGEIGIDRDGGDTQKYLSEKGTFESLPEIDIDEKLSIDRTDGSDNKYLSEKGTFESLPEVDIDIDEKLSIDRIDGIETKVLSQKGSFVDLPEEIDVIDEIGIDKASGSESKYLSEKGTFVDLPEEIDIDEGLGIDRVGGDEDKYLSEKGDFVALPDASAEIGIDKTTGSKQKYLSERGTFENIPTVEGFEPVDVFDELNIDRADGDTQKYLSEKGTFESLPEVDIDDGLNIDREGGVETKVLSQKGSFVDLPDVIDEIGINKLSGDEDKYLSEKGTFKSLPEEIDVDNVIGVDRTGGSENKVLSQKGVFVDLPEEINIDSELNIDRTDGSKDKYLSETGTFEFLPDGIDINNEIGIDREDGVETKVLSQKGSFVDLPEVDIDIDDELGINRVSGSDSKYLSEKGDFKSLPEEVDVDDELNIDREGGVETKVLSQKGTFVDLPEVDVDNELGIDRDSGSDNKVLSEKGNFVNLPSGGTSYTAGAGIDISNDTIAIDTAGAQEGQILEKTTEGLGWGNKPISANTSNVQEALGINPTTGNAGKLLSQRGLWVDAPSGTGTGGIAVTKLRLARPYFDMAMHLVIEKSVSGSFEDAEEIIDTSVDASRVKVSNGTKIVEWPPEGTGGAYDAQMVVVELANLVTEPVYLRYKWTAQAGDSDWYFTPFPSVGEAYVAPPASSGGGGETPAPTAFGTLKVNISGAMTGQWSADGGSTWHDSGDTITVATGTHTVTFAYVDGYTTPSSQSVTISENTLSTVSAEYYEIEEPTETEGTLVVNITGAAGGRWSVDGGTTWKSGGQSLLLTAGSYTITFEPILGYSKPDDISATIVAGNITVKSGAYVEQPDSADPTDYGMTWDNGTEPVLEEGNKVIFVTPTGAGNFSGDSWANAKAGLYTAGLAASDGDVLYVQEGTYTSHLAPVAATKSIGIYGGFTVADGTWATRDNFAHPSIIDAGSKPSVPFIRPESGVTQTVDGVACTGFTGGVMLANGGTATVRNCAIYDCGGTVSSHAVDNCLILNCTGSTGAATDCIFLNCSSSSGYIVSGGATNCTFTNCSSSGYGSNYIITGGATNCTFTNCSSSSHTSGYGNSVIVSGGATDCTFTNCSSSGTGSSNSAIVTGGATNCTFTNCRSSSSYSYSYSAIVVGGATNCTFVRCVADRLHYTQSGNDITNCVIFGCDIDTIDFGAGTNNAASAYIDANTLVLGTDNTLAKFASLGTVETIGYSETLNNTPAEDFGDFRPQAGSVLIGAGVAVSGITDDIEGNLRPDPPTIGAYEYVEEA